jgi:2-keto-4-pentenoate hydratase/2-oxohepta-3-ene-1,7-dioic acid hydratase in catechol pathway
MQLVSIRESDSVSAGVLLDGQGVIRCVDLVDALTGDAMAVLSAVSPQELRQRATDSPASRFRDPQDLIFAAPYLRPRKIWGIGINYVAHAADLGATPPQGEPASFIKGDHTVIGPGEPIPLPTQSERVTAEGEIGLVIGRLCRNVDEASALSYVWGACPILDQTAEDILQRNPRYLTRAKNFPGFFSFGPGIVALDEILDDDGGLDAIEVSTLVNGEVKATNTVKNMMFSPQLLVSFHSQVMPLFPGDIISTGTPGAAVIHAGDEAEARVTRVGRLTNPVIA